MKIIYNGQKTFKFDLGLISSIKGNVFMKFLDYISNWYIEVISDTEYKLFVNGKEEKTELYCFQSKLDYGLITCSDLLIDKQWISKYEVVDNINEVLNIESTSKSEV